MINFLKQIHIPLLASVVYILLILIKSNTNLAVHMPLITVLLACEFLVNKIHLEQIKKELEQKETYVASIIHDLKNPIIAEIRIIESLIKNKNLNHKNSEILKQLLCSDKLMLEMVISILNTYKYSNGKINYNFEEFNFLELVSTTCKELTYCTNEENNFEIRANNNMQRIFADKIQLKRVISNLISNALKYKTENSKIFIELNNTSEDYKFSITNSGQHISPKTQEKLFDKYVSESSKFNNISTGLGLYLSKRIINDHLGRIIVKSSKEGINTFSFTIPKNITTKSGNNIRPNNLPHQKDVSKISELYQT